VFDPNTRVVCVDDTFPAGINDIFNALPSKGVAYTVRDIAPGVQFDLKQTCAVYLVELVNRPNQHSIEPGFAPHRFRELEQHELESLEYAEATA
jgi:hypothetical protein